MKKYIYITGILSANFMFLGAMFKVMHFPGAGILLTLSIFTLCFLFLPFALHNAYHNSNPKRYGLIYIVTYIVFFIVFIGALFKVMHWPGAGWFLIFGIPLPLVAFLPVYLIQTRKDKKYSIVNFMGIMFGMVFLTVFSALLAVNISATVVNSFEGQYKHNQNLVDNIYNESSSNDTQVQQKADDLNKFIEEIKTQLLAATNNNLNSELHSLDNTKTTLHVLFHYNDVNNIDILKSKIRAFNEAVLSSDKANDELKKMAEIMFNVEDIITDNGNEYRWEDEEFFNYYLVIVLDALTRLESNVKFVEHELMN